MERYEVMYEKSGIVKILVMLRDTNSLLTAFYIQHDGLVSSPNSNALVTPEMLKRVAEIAQLVRDINAKNKEEIRIAIEKLQQREAK